MDKQHSSLESSNREEKADDKASEPGVVTNMNVVIGVLVIPAAMEMFDKILAQGGY